MYAGESLDISLYFDDIEVELAQCRRYRSRVIDGISKGRFFVASVTDDARYPSFSR